MYIVHIYKLLMNKQTNHTHLQLHTHSKANTQLNLRRCRPLGFRCISCCYVYLLACLCICIVAHSCKHFWNYCIYTLNFWLHNCKAVIVFWSVVHYFLLSFLLSCLLSVLFSFGYIISIYVNAYLQCYEQLRKLKVPYSGMNYLLA